MTIRFLNDWNGYKAGMTRTLSAAEETAALGARVAVDVAAAPASPVEVRFDPSTSSLVGPDGKPVSMVSGGGNSAAYGTQANPADLIVYGGTPAGIMAAIAAAKLNKRVLLLSESERLGGMVGWGINHQDTKLVAPGVLTGLSREYLTRVPANESNSIRSFLSFYNLSCEGTPSWFKRVFDEMLAQYGANNITVIYNTELKSAAKTGTVIQSVTVSAAGGADQVLYGKQFVDASYCGDLIAAAGCTFRIGREANSTYGETNNGIRTPVTWVGLTTLDVYVTPGDTGSGLLPYVDGSGAGTVGATDGRVMLFNFRLYVTNNAADRVPFPAPDMGRYSPLNYELMGRAMAAAPTSFDAFDEVFGLYTAKLGSTVYRDLNAKAGLSTNYPNQAECKEYITASKARRAEIAENAKQWILGMMYWIRYSGDARIPAALVTEIATWGLCASELQAYGGFSPEFYVREGRRVVGDYVMKEQELTLANGFADQAIAWAYYDLDSHTVRYIHASGNLRIEGHMLNPMSNAAAPQIGSAIPFKVLLPKVTEATNLLCPGCPSVSRVVWTTVRMEPILMMLGEAAGVAASLAIDNASTLQALDVTRIMKVLDPYEVTDGLVLSTDGSYAAGTVTQTPAASWTASNSRFGALGASALNDGGTGTGKTLKFAPNIVDPGAYEVLFKYPPSSDFRASNAKVTVSHAGGTVTLPINQFFSGGRGGHWESLGVYTFRAGTPSADFALVDNDAANGVVIASAFKFRKINSY